MFGKSRARILESRLRQLEKKMLQWAEEGNNASHPLDRVEALTWKSAAEMCYLARTGKRWADD